MEVAAEKATEMMRFEATELRLGLPGNGGGGGGEVVVGSSVRKRGFSETVDLQLNLSSSTTTTTTTTTKEPPQPAAAGKLLEGGSATTTPSVENKMEKKSLLQAQTAHPDPAKPPAKAQVVGWPPVRSYRKNMLQAAAAPSSVKKSPTNSSKDKVTSAESEVAAGGASFVKVSMDGAPYLRKVDLKMYGSYKQLSDALSNMFNSFSSTANNEAASGLKDFMIDGSKPMSDTNNNYNNNNNSDDYVPTYEDKDGDWMLVGDVPWEMFVVSCKRLRIMKGKDAITGLAPRGMEKRKNRA